MRALTKRVVLGRGIAVAASIVLVGSATAVGTSVSAATAANVTIDTSSQSSVVSAYKSIYVPAMTDTVGWTGSVDGCNPGTTSAQSQQYSLDIINFDRALAGLDPVTLDPALNTAAQAGALIMSANGSLSHDVPKTWTCYTSAGASAAAASDLFLGESGARAIDGYMIDPGSSNTEAGHRRWIMYPAATTMGTGSTSNSNDLYVFGGRANDGSYADPAWVSWPTAGYFPSPLEPNGRWSLSGSAEHSYSFAKATVSVKTSGGKSLPVHVNTPANGYGADTIVFQVSGLATPTDAAAGYTVSVKNIVEDGKTTSHSYSVKIFNPNTLDVDGVPQITGFTREGQYLTAVAPQFSPAATSYSYQWYRNGKSVSGATHSTHHLTSGDLGKTITVRVTGHHSGYGALAAMSVATAAVGQGLTPTASVAPAISGTARVGETLSVDAGQWSPETGTVTYQWYRSGKAISGATGAERTLTSSDHGHAVSVRVTVHPPGYNSSSKTAKAPVVQGALS